MLIVVARHQSKIQSDKRENHQLELLRSNKLREHIEQLVAGRLSGLHGFQRAQHSMPGVPPKSDMTSSRSGNFVELVVVVVVVVVVVLPYRSCSSVRNEVPSSFLIWCVNADTVDDVIVSHQQAVDNVIIARHADKGLIV